jgi:2'-hydroxyisoflavone reductase
MDKILILGGTNFIGRTLVDSLIQHDDFDITLFNRGKSNPDLYPTIKKIQGDRNTSDINVIFKEKWDFIIDLSCYFPDSLSHIVSHLDKSIKRYVFISTCSVYDNDLDKSILRNENSPTLNCTAKERTDTSVATYGKRKAECERILIQSDLRYSIFRPALVYGPFDSTDRFYYWLYQIKKGNQLLIPNQGKDLFSVTYVKDLIQLITKSLNVDFDSDTYNATTYPDLSISKLIDVTSQLLDKHPDLFFAGSDFFNENKIAQWIDLPLWLDCDYFTYGNTKILRDFKIEITDFKDSVSETINYYDLLDWKEPIYGIPEKTKNKLIDKITTANTKYRALKRPIL